MCEVYLRLAVLICLAGLTGACAGPGNTNSTREVVLPAGAVPGATPYSPGIRVGNLIYVSGQVAGDAGPDIRLQTDAVLKKIQAIVETAGSSMASVDKCTVFLARQEDFAGMNDVWHKAFPSNAPARSTVVATLVRPEFLVEMDCVGHT
jgi:2-iminobutanoate/2-iminopropanoate deaminase